MIFTPVEEEISDKCRDCVFANTDCPGGMWCSNDEY